MKKTTTIAAFFAAAVVSLPAWANGLVNGDIVIDRDGASVTSPLYGNSTRWIDVSFDTEILNENCDLRNTQMQYIFDGDESTLAAKYGQAAAGAPKIFEAFFYPFDAYDRQRQVSSVSVWFNCSNGEESFVSETYDFNLQPRPADQETVLLSCNAGDLEVVQYDNPLDGTVTRAHVRSAGVTSYLVEESQKEIVVRDNYFDRDVLIRKNFSYNVEQQGQELVINGMRRSERNGEVYFHGGQDTPTITLRNGGADLEVWARQMVSSHSMTRYLVGQWFFESCTLP